MSLEHEYTLLAGFNRARVGRYLSLLAAAVSALIVFVLLALVDLAKKLGLPANLPPSVLSLVGAGAVYTALYWLFDRYVWKFPVMTRLLSVPNLSGIWRCDGQTINPDGGAGYVWQGEVVIVQSWDRIRIHLRTEQSSSNSIAAALVYDAADGYRLMYHYKNEPKIEETELNAHHGFAELTFSADCRSAEGEYFNGHGRYTFGKLRLSKER